MISENLKSLAGLAGQWRDQGGVRLDPTACQILEAQLDEAADQVRTMEHAPPPLTPETAVTATRHLRLLSGGAA